MRFKELDQYKREHGDTLVPQNYPDNSQLGTWVNTQRVQYKLKEGGQACRMTDERVRKLNSIGFIWDVEDAAWEEMFLELNQYKHVHGHTRVPEGYPDNPQLGRWVIEQRQNNKKNKLAPERVDKLNEIGFDWDAQEAAWEEMFQQLEEYKKIHGDTLVPKNYSDNIQLARWVCTQRHQFKLKESGKKSNMTDKRVDKLNKIDFVWNPNEAAWQSKYELLVSFYKEFGHTKIPLGEEHKELYGWCMRQRNLKAEGRLKEHRYDKLKKINFDFFGQEAKGSSRLENMIIYELERMDHEFQMKNEVFYDVRYKYRPDGVIFVDDAFVIFFEVDERHHSRYSTEKESHRMKALHKEAGTQGYDRVAFVRVSTGLRREINCDQSVRQLKFVNNHLNELKSSTRRPHAFSIYYIDYPVDHFHVHFAKRRFDEVHVLNSQ